MTDTPALALEHISKRFGDVTALVDASLALRPGTVHALLGENGAGKTTLMRIAFGMQSNDSGTVHVGGSPVRLASPSDAIALGIAPLAPSILINSTATSPNIVIDSV